LFKQQNKYTIHQLLLNFKQANMQPALPEIWAVNINHIRLNESKFHLNPIYQCTIPIFHVIV